MFLLSVFSIEQLRLGAICFGPPLTIWSMMPRSVNTGVANACVRTKGAAPPDENCMIGLTLSLDSPLISGNYRENMEMPLKNKIIYKAHCMLNPLKCQRQYLQSRA